MERNEKALPKAGLFKPSKHLIKTLLLKTESNILLSKKDLRVIGSALDIPLNAYR